MAMLKLSKSNSYVLLAACLSFDTSDKCSKLVEGVNARHSAKHMTKSEDCIRRAIKEYAEKVDELKMSFYKIAQNSYNALPKEEQNEQVGAKLTAEANAGIFTAAESSGINSEGADMVEIEIGQDELKFLNSALDKFDNAISHKASLVAISDALEESLA